MIYPKSDWNGAFQQHSIDELIRHDQVKYYEVASDEEMACALKEATRSQKAALLELGGHGIRTAISFGAGNPAKGPIAAESAVLDLGDGRQLADANIRESVAPGAHVIVKSCSTGQGMRLERNMANFLADVLPRANVYAPTAPTNNRIRLGSDGSTRSTVGTLTTPPLRTYAHLRRRWIGRAHT